MRIKELLHLLRVHQWYKNLVVFLALFFSGNVLNLDLLLTSILAFVSLCLISGANYIINDLADLRKDRLQAEKRVRPLASGKVSTATGIIVALLCLGGGLVIAYNIGIQFLVAALLLFTLSQLYTFYLKNIVFADILAIATLFVIRAIAGALSINVTISPWLILCPFFLSLFLSVGKRHAELHLLKEKAAATRKVLREYNHELTDSLMVISTTLLIISYALYSFLSEHRNLLYTLPSALFVIFRFYYLIQNGSEIGRHPEKVMRDRAMIVGMLLWIVVTTYLVYV